MCRASLSASGVENVPSVQDGLKPRSIYWEMGERHRVSLP